MRKTFLLMIFFFCSLLLLAEPEGNIVRQVNADFSHGTTGWYLWMHDNSSGEFKEESGHGKIKIIEPGLNLWSMGISNLDINLEKGKTYKVEFEAKADPPIKITSDVNLNRTPWTQYWQETFDLTTNMEKYSYTFRMGFDTDPAASFQLMFGGQVKSTITFGNVVITDLGNNPVDTGAETGPSIMQNGDFSAGTRSWYFWVNDSGKGDFKLENGQAKINVTEPGPNTWSVGLSNVDIPIEKGKTYKVVFEAKADPAINIISEVHFNSAPWTTYSGQKTFPMTAGMEKYSYTFKMGSDTDQSAAFQLMFGGQAKSTVTFGNVAIIDMNNNAGNKNSQEGQASEAEAITTTAAEQSILPNSDFSKGTDGWKYWAYDGAKGEFKLIDNAAVVRIDDQGQTGWSDGLSCSGLKIEYGRTYEVSFIAKAEQKFPLISDVMMNKAPYTSYARMRRFTLGPKFKKFTYTFTMYYPNDPISDLQFLFPSKGLVTICNISVRDVTQKQLEPVPVVPQDKKLNTDMDKKTVFIYAQELIQENNPWIYEVKADVNVRSVIKWGTSGNKPGDFNFDAVKASHNAGLIYMGGMTTVIQKKEFKDEAQFLDMATRDANNNLVPWTDVTLGIGVDEYRGSLANPKYRKYVIDMCEIQIDGGADGIHFDEPNSPYLGGPQRNWSNNEGFEDYSIADFNRYLLAKYPNYTSDDWKKEFKMTDDNILKKDVAPDDLEHNFNYRRYLQKNGWTGNDWGGSCVLSKENPLAKEWGKVIGNRMYLSDTFTGTYIPKYYKEIINELRKYAMEKYGKKLLITDNGIMPYADFNSLGIYWPNTDKGDNITDWSGYKYVPLLNGRLMGSASLMDAFKNMYAKNRKTAGNVPLVFFLDFTNQDIENYCALPLEQKKDFWQIYAAEAYAAGCYYAFHMETMNAEPTSQDLGMLEFTRDYAKYYKDHEDLYHHNEYADNAVKVEGENISYNLMKQDEAGRFVLHLINHNYDGKINPQAGVKASVEIEKKPSKVYMVSPDFNGKREIPFKYDGKTLKINIKSLKYYDVVVIKI